MRQTLNELEIVGYPNRHRELSQRQDLLEGYPTEAREILAQRDGTAGPHRAGSEEHNPVDAPGSSIP